ncbi:MAG: MBL fold metallo-hydrolase [candidate division KSB1 bacterium]|nr:MBL fold metallo-hydrolase [candidate division KSB1 bacterium]
MPVTEVVTGLWMITVPDFRAQVNCYLIDTGDGLLLFDTGPRKTAPVLLELMRQIDFAPPDIKWIVLSHSHADHTGALAEIAESSGATVYAHPAAEGWLIDHQRQFRERFEAFLPYMPVEVRFKNHFFDSLGRPWYPNTWLESLPYALNTARGLEIVYTPGHSADSVSLLMKEEGILLCGDAFMGAGVGGSLPRYDDPEQYVETLESLLDMHLSLLLSGHFAPMNSDKLALALQQSQKMAYILQNFIDQSVQRKPEGYDIGFLTRMVCARFARPADASAAITVQAHLMALERKGKVHFDIDRWKPGPQKQPIVIASVVGD